jgi:hypothetical protein
LTRVKWHLPPRKGRASKLIPEHSLKLSPNISVSFLFVLSSISWHTHFYLLGTYSFYFGFVAAVKLLLKSI